MAIVYKAYQPNIDRDVAVKVISRIRGRDAGTNKRFQREARFVARLGETKKALSELKKTKPLMLQAGN